MAVKIVTETKTVARPKPIAVKSAAKTVPAKPAAASKPAAKPAAKTKPGKLPPATKSVAKPVRRTQGDAIAMFLDLDNTGVSITNVLEVISILKTMGHIAYGKLYGYTDERVADFEEIVLENKLDVAGKLRMKPNTNVIDLRLVIEAVTLTEKHRYDAVFIWTGPGDLVPLFAYLRDLDTKVLTVDIPEIDCKNKFVSQAIQLYSRSPAATQTTSSSEAPVPASERPAAKAFAPLMEDVAKDAPALPRIKGAPAFGASAEELVKYRQNQEGNELMTPEEERNYLIDMAARALSDYEQETKSENEWAALDPVDAPKDDFSPAPEPVDPAVDAMPGEVVPEKPAELPHSYEDEPKTEPQPVPDYNPAEDKSVPVETEKITEEEPTADFTDFGDFGTLAKVPK